MILAIRTDTSASYLALIDQGVPVSELTWESGRELAKNLLAKIVGLCADASVPLTALDGVIYYKGPGSFTGLRIGATVANTLAYSVGIPIIGVNGDSWLVDGATKLSKNLTDSVVIPEYGAEAHITL
jgi:tRNA threonylcarbamoyladenosine biosynthesis protein TsaB